MVNIIDRILMPAFSTMNVHNMFDDMMDIISQLVLKWERFVTVRSSYHQCPADKTMLGSDLRRGLIHQSTSAR